MTITAYSSAIVDAMLGTGFSHDAVRAPFDTWIDASNEHRRRGAYVVAADCPSGLNAQTGAAAAPSGQEDTAGRWPWLRRAPDRPEQAG